MSVTLHNASPALTTLREQKQTDYNRKHTVVQPQLFSSQSAKHSFQQRVLKRIRIKLKKKKTNQPHGIRNAVTHHLCSIVLECPSPCNPILPAVSSQPLTSEEHRQIICLNSFVFMCLLPTALQMHICSKSKALLRCW